MNKKELKLKHRVQKFKAINLSNVTVNVTVFHGANTKFPLLFIIHVHIC